MATPDAPAETDVVAEADRLRYEKYILRLIVDEFIAAADQIMETGNGVGRLNAARQNAKYMLAWYVK
jgi:hypothetical protein